MPLQSQQQGGSLRDELEFTQMVMRLSALTVVVFLRPDCGFRLLNPLGLLAVNGFLIVISLLAQPGNDDNQPVFLLLFAVLALLLGMSQRFKRLQEFKRGVIQHSYYVGTSPFSKLQWVPMLFRHDRRCERFLDPLCIIGVGIVLFSVSRLLGMWLVFTGGCLRAWEFEVHRRERNWKFDQGDNLVIAEKQTAVIEQFEESPIAAPQQPAIGIPTGIGDDIRGRIELSRRSVTTTNINTKHNSMNTSNNNLPSNVWKKAFDLADRMQPLKSRKNPAAAAVIGFAFGGIGLGIYFGTILDFVVPFTILLILFLFAFPTAGLALVFLPFLCAMWGYKRAAASNARLDAKNITPPTVIL
jgi:hypothetical protein